MEILMKVAILTTILFLITSTSQAKDCSKHPIYCQIKENLSKARNKDGTFRKIKPWMTEKQMMELSNIIYKASRKYKVPANIYTAILRQESTYRIGARGCHTGLDENYEKTRVCADFGMSMVNHTTAKAFNIDIKRLTEDVEYSVNMGAMILADFKKRYFHKEEFWWTRYNASTPYKRRFYQGLVEDWL